MCVVVWVSIQCFDAVCWMTDRTFELKLEDAQRVHISTKYTIMLLRTHLHVYIRASLVMYVHVQRPKWAREHCLIQASLGSSRTDWCVSTNE